MAEGHRISRRVTSDRDSVERPGGVERTWKEEMSGEPRRARSATGGKKSSNREEGTYEFGGRLVSKRSHRVARRTLISEGNRSRVIERVN